MTVSSIKGYRSCISSVLRVVGTAHLTSDVSVANLVRSFGIQRPVVRKLFPAWDLARVLRSLLREPYEPMATTSWALLTQKTVFLLALASSKRRSELSAWSIDPGLLRFGQGNLSVTIMPAQWFRAKTQGPQDHHVPVVIPALSPVAGAEIERLQCPVRALRHYITRTKHEDVRRGRTDLFLPYSGTAARVSPALISKWIVAVVKRAYDLDPQEDDSEFFKATAHEVRALSTSWAAANGVPLAEVLAAASWRTQSTFTSHYFREFTGSSANLFSLGPLVAAQSVVQPSGSV